jgi:hypothetical protein
MLFPNFYVPSVGLKFVTDFERTRMSLSHPSGRKLKFPQIFRRFVTESQIWNTPGRLAPKNRAGCPHIGFETRQNEDAIVVRRFHPEFSIDADWQVDLNPSRHHGVWGGWVRHTGACQDH